MVIGNGLLAKAFAHFEDKNEFLIFASGVSNSINASISDFQREENLLLTHLNTHPDKHFVYFSTCSIYDASLLQNPYAQHKLAMENLIQEKHPNFHIFRISNVVGQTNNPHTVINFFHQHIENKQPFQLWKEAYRNIIDVDDAYLIARYITDNQLFNNEIINIANTQNTKAIDIVKLLEKNIGHEGIYNIVNRKSEPNIDVSKIIPIIDKLSINFDSDYLERLIRKYYP